jgi:DNA-binding GntR family transcriptional regulator
MRQIDTNLISDKVVAELRREILYGTLKPHQELYQDKIAQELGVSRMPVREALQVLAMDGFITVRPNKVATVNEVSGKFIRDFYDVRILLETTAIRLACQNHPDCSPAWNAFHAGEEMIKINDFNGYNVQNEEIHRFIWQAADNSKLQQIMRQMWHAMDIGSKPAETARASNEEHGILLRCIEQNSPEEAEETMRRHIERSYERVLEAIRIHGK